MTIGIERLNAWAQQEPRLAQYAHAFDRLAKRAAHVRSAEVEEVLSQAMDPFGAMTATHGVLANAELKFEPARGADGATYEVAQGTINDLLAHSDRAVVMEKGQVVLEGRSEDLAQDPGALTRLLGV